MSPKARTGRSVTLPPVVAPTKYRTLPCPCCGQERKVINGRWLAYLRTRARMDQRALATTLGTSAPYLSDIERNRREPSEEIIAGYEAL